MKKMIKKYSFTTWKLAWVIPPYAALVLWCLMVAVFNLDYKLALEARENNQ